MLLPGFGLRSYSIFQTLPLLLPGAADQVIDPEKLKLWCPVVFSFIVVLLICSGLGCVGSLYSD
jgi:hypothetical protein